MQGFRFRFALVISLVLILGALWFRISASRTTAASLVAVEDAQNSGESDIISAEDFLAQSSTTVPTGSLSTTDLVGRQLFSDYMGLVNQGQATESNLTSLAETYVNALNTIPQGRSVGREELHTVEDTIENLQAYSEAVFALRNKYRSLATEATRGKTISDSNSSGFISLMSRLGNLYKAGGEELIGVAVPASMADTHQKLINNYFSSADAMNTLSKSDEDPLKAYVALDTQSKNNTEEEELLSIIQKTLMANGIISTSGT
jgi:hypothetical protein